VGGQGGKKGRWGERPRGVAKMILAAAEVEEEVEEEGEEKTTFGGMWKSSMKRCEGVQV